jgi:hypothetical protein
VAFEAASAQAVAALEVADAACGANAVARQAPVEDRFDIAESRNGNSFRVVATVNPNTTSFSRYGLRAGTTYMYRVRACNAAGCSPWSNTATATTPKR